MCGKTIEKVSWVVEIVSDQYKTQGGGGGAGGGPPRSLACVLDRFKTQEMCIKAVEAGPCH